MLWWPKIASSYHEKFFKMNKLERENKHVSVFGFSQLFFARMTAIHATCIIVQKKSILSLPSWSQWTVEIVIIGLLFITSVIDIFISVILFQQHKNNEIRSLILFSMFLRSHKILHGRRNKNKNHFHQILFLKLKNNLISFSSFFCSWEFPLVSPFLWFYFGAIIAHATVNKFLFYIVKFFLLCFFLLSLAFILWYEKIWEYSYFVRLRTSFGIFKYQTQFIEFKVIF